MNTDPSGLFRLATSILVIALFVSTVWALFWLEEHSIIAFRWAVGTPLVGVVVWAVYYVLTHHS